MPKEPPTVHCAELVISGINYAACDGPYRLNASNDCTAPNKCTGHLVHWSDSTSSATAGSRQMWWCDTKYVCTPWDTTPCGGSFGSTTTAECTRCEAGYSGGDCSVENFASSAGGSMLLALFGVAAAYLVGGTAYNMHKNGLRGAAALPHRAQWRQLAALVTDGFHFTKSRSGIRPSSSINSRSGSASPTSKSKGKSKSSSSSGGSSPASNKGGSPRSEKIGKQKKSSKRSGQQAGGDDGDSMGASLLSTSTADTAAEAAPPEKEWSPTRTGHISVGARETGVKVQM